MSIYVHLFPFIIQSKIDSENTKLRDISLFETLTKNTNLLTKILNKGFQNDFFLIIIYINFIKINMAKNTKEIPNKEQVQSQTEQDEKEKRISVAVMFLQNPEVQKMNKQSIIGFLKKKKLSDAEIEEAQNRLKEKIENQKKQEIEEKQKQQELIEQEKKQKIKVFDTQVADQMKINQDLINLSHTGITQLTEEQNSQLNPIVLNVSFNTQFAITDMNKFDRLERLYASGCNLRFINPKFIPLQLKILNLSHNYLISMEFIGQLDNIELLNLSYNQIDQIVKLEALTKLYHLNLKQNLIYEIPKSQILGQLRYLNLIDNPINDPNNLLQTCDPKKLLELE
ncbi:hypothetical protein pb186bvf_007358 [Paramecium bursaria]